MALGEARSKCDHLSRIPLRPDTAQRLHLLYLAKGVRATTAIEGNTLTENQVLERLEGKLQLPESKEYLGREVDNIKTACDRIFDEAVRTDDARVTPELVCAFNGMVLAGLELPDEVVPGTIRGYDVGVGAYRGAPHQDCEFLLGRLCDWLDEEWTDGHDFAANQNRPTCANENRPTTMIVIFDTSAQSFSSHSSSSRFFLAFVPILQRIRALPHLRGLRAGERLKHEFSDCGRVIAFELLGGLQRSADVLHRFCRQRWQR